tara:strand:- start:4715 stop:4939 length:225 start_codon:yes stop_codon:yes gene_type:complete
METYYTVKHAGKEGRIKALNRPSAEKQFEWLVKNNECFCRECTKGFLSSYNVYMDVYNDYHQGNVHIINGFMQG